MEKNKELLLMIEFQEVPITIDSTTLTPENHLTVLGGVQFLKKLVQSTMETTTTCLEDGCLNLFKL